ncbi:hypothetical protein VDGL01_00045 [Verticillium dahliae]
MLSQSSSGGTFESGLKRENNSSAGRWLWILDQAPMTKWGLHKPKPQSSEQVRTYPRTFVPLPTRLTLFLLTLDPLSCPPLASCVPPSSCLPPPLPAPLFAPATGLASPRLLVLFCYPSPASSKPTIVSSSEVLAPSYSPPSCGGLLNPTWNSNPSPRASSPSQPYHTYTYTYTYTYLTPAPPCLGSPAALNFAARAQPRDLQIPSLSPSLDAIANLIHLA